MVCPAVALLWLINKCTLVHTYLESMPYPKHSYLRMSSWDLLLSSQHDYARPKVREEM